MRIVHVTDHFQPQLGYQEAYLARDQARLGHDVTVVTSDRLARVAAQRDGGRTVRAGRAEEFGVQVVRLPVRVEAPTEAAYVWMRDLAPTLAELAPDVVHCHGVFSLTAMQVAWAKRRLGFRLVYDSHMAAFNVYRPWDRGWQRQVKRRVYPALARLTAPLVLRQADLITAIGEPERAYLRELFGRRCPETPIVRLGADAELFRFQPETRERLRAGWGWAADDVVLGHAGAVRPSKGIDRLLAAAAWLATQGAPVRVLVLGKVAPDYRAHLTAEAARLGIADRVMLEDAVPVARLPEYLSAMDLGVWPGDVSITFIEAMSVGLPIVALRSPYTEAIIERHGAGALADCDDPATLAQVLEPLVRDPALCRCHAERARAAVEEHLSWTSIARQYLDLYAQVLGRSSCTS